jgi:hypothetical protein
VPAQVEQQGPVLSGQIDDAKKQLGSLVISETAYQELQQLPQHRRSLADEVRLVTHEALLQLKQDNEALRVSLQVRAPTPLPPSALAPCPPLSHAACQLLLWHAGGA